MIYYLNIGFVLEQALRDIFQNYIDKQSFDDVYGNFHISVTNDHPFAHMIIEPHARASDHFPSIVVTSQSDSKVPDLVNMPNQFTGIGFTSADFNELINTVYRTKTKVNKNGEVVKVIKNGEEVKERIPGYVLVYDEAKINALKEIADSRTQGDVPGCVYGIRYSTCRRDRISIEVWAENNQLKNEIYEQLRLLLMGSFNQVMAEKYSLFHPSMFDGSVNGQRSSNYNFDFDVLLCGSHLDLEIDYTVSQIIFDTDIENINREIITEVINHVKN